LRRIGILLRGGEPGGAAREADALHEYYRTPEERRELVSSYVRAHARRIAELAGVGSLEDVEDPGRLLEITDADRADYFSWPEGEGSVTFLDEEGNALSTEQWRERMERKARALARDEDSPERG